MNDKLQTYDQMFHQTQQDIEAFEKELQILSDVDASEKNSALNKAKTALNIIDGILEKRELVRSNVLVLFERITVYEDGRAIIMLQDEMLGRLMMPERRIVEKPCKQPEKVYEVSQTANVLSDGDPAHTTFTAITWVDSPWRLSQRLERNCALNC